MNNDSMFDSKVELIFNLKCLIEFAECVLPFSSVHMEESSMVQGAQGMLVQNWPTVSSAAGE